MIIWPRFSDLFSFRSPAKPSVATARDLADADLDAKGGSVVEALESPVGDYISPEEATWMKIRFDNMLRLWVAVSSYLVCLMLWYSGVIPSIGPVNAIFGCYAVYQLGFNVFLFRTPRPWRLDYILHTADLFGITLAVTYTGGSTSPLYVMYFIPIIVEAFHRNWAMLIFQGFGGVLLYGAVLAVSIDEWNSSQAADLGARLFFMLLAVSVAALAVNLMRKKDVIDETRLSRMQLLTYFAQVLNRMGFQDDLPAIARDLVEKLNLELGRQIDGWCRIFLIEHGNAGLMKAIAAPNDARPDLKQELPSGACPALQSNGPFLLRDSEKDVSCPVESFSFGSHLCIPVAGSESESFGVLFCGSKRKDAFRQEELQFLRFIGRALGLGIQRVQRMEELRKVLEMDTCAMAAFMGSAKSTEAVVRAILDGFVTLLMPGHLSLLLWDPHAGELKTVGIRSPFEFPEQNIVFRMGEGIPGRVLETGEPTLTTDVREDARYRGKMSAIKSMVCLPLRSVKGEPLGVVTALRIGEGKPFSVKEIAIATTFASRAALAVENAMLHHAYRDEIARLHDEGPRNVQAA